jgi:hypothetical protein
MPSHGKLIITSFFSAAGRRTSRNLRNVQIQAVLTADAGLDVSQVRLEKLKFLEHALVTFPAAIINQYFYHLLQMAPLGDRLLVKPKEKEEVRNVLESNPEF